MNIQLANVISDISGTTGMAILRDIVRGERDPERLAMHKHSRIRASRKEIAQSLEGTWRPELLFVLEQVWIFTRPIRIKSRHALSVLTSN